MITTGRLTVVAVPISRLTTWAPLEKILGIILDCRHETQTATAEEIGENNADVVPWTTDKINKKLLGLEPSHSVDLQQC